ncbi:MAG TPA: hypothetical protein VGO31_14685 [Microbacteriaceae bacterium]|nr:hypothetical protein [Microbacteriaceae bacterium]
MAPKGATAWLVRWEQTPGEPLPIAEDGEVVAVLPGRWSDRRVEDVLERLYAERAYTPAEQLQWRAAGSSPYAVQTLFHVHGIPVGGFGLWCGHNPMLVARRVERLRALDECTLSWVEVQPSHAGFLCKSRGFPDCPQADQPPTELSRTWTARAVVIEDKPAQVLEESDSSAERS